MHPTADTWQTLIIAVTYTVEMGGGEKMEKLCVLNFNVSSELSVGNVGYLLASFLLFFMVLVNSPHFNLRTYLSCG